MVTFYKKKDGFLLFELSISMFIEAIVAFGFVFLFNFVFIEEINFLKDQYLASEMFVNARISSTHSERYTFTGFKANKEYLLPSLQYYEPNIYFKIQYDYTPQANHYLFFYDYLDNYKLDHTKIGGRLINKEREKLLNVVPVTGGLTLP